MYFRSFLICLSVSGFALKASAQKVVRRGVAPIQLIKKNAIAEYSLPQFEGKWQEVKRTAVKEKKIMEFTDTLLLKFHNNKVELKDATSMNISMKGSAEIEAPNFLIVAGDEYTIVSLDTAKLVIYDGEVIKELEKRQQFHYETFGKLTIPTDTLNTPVIIDPQNIEGKWSIYRKQALAGSVGIDAVLIKSLEIFPSDRTGSALGQVVFYKKNISQSLPCKIIFGKGNILVITDLYNWDFNTYKANGSEFVFGETGVFLYYSKRL